MDKLKPCPFCGCKAILCSTGNHFTVEKFFVSCGVCGVETPRIARTRKEAITAWTRRAQPENKPCAGCSGIVYRQTASGKIIPADAKCAVIEPPPCYQPDNDGCAYQIYGDNDDEPIDQCKACPLCYSDKVRHITNKPLTLDELREMEGEPVYMIYARHGLDSWFLSRDAQDYVHEVEQHGAIAYCHKPKEERHDAD